MVEEVRRSNAKSVVRLLRPRDPDKGLEGDPKKNISYVKPNFWWNNFYIKKGVKIFLRLRRDNKNGVLSSKKTEQLCGVSRFYFL